MRYLKIANTALKNNRPTSILIKQKLACFVLYLNIINIFLKNNILCILCKELKNGIEILVSQVIKL